MSNLLVVVFMTNLFYQSIESIRTDGTGRYTFWDFLESPAQSLAVFNGWFYLADEKRIWQVPQNLPSAKNNGFLLKASLPVLTVYHELQQPQGEFSFLNGFELFCGYCVSILGQAITN